MKPLGLALVAALALATPPLTAQQAAPALDRSKIPPPGKPPVLRVPAWTNTTLGESYEEDGESLVGCVYLGVLYELGRGVAKGQVFIRPVSPDSST